MGGRPSRPTDSVLVASELIAVERANMHIAKKTKALMFMICPSMVFFRKKSERIKNWGQTPNQRNPSCHRIKMVSDPNSFCFPPFELHGLGGGSAFDTPVETALPAAFFVTLLTTPFVTLFNVEFEEEHNEY
jgi:hypothetical protein